MKRIQVGIEELLFSDAATRKKLLGIDRNFCKAMRRWERREGALAYGCDGKDEREVGRFLEKIYALDSLNCEALNCLNEFYSVLSVKLLDEGKEATFSTILDGSDFANRYFQAMYDKAMLMSAVRCLDNGKRPEVSERLNSMWNVLGIMMMNSAIGGENSIAETLMDIYGLPVADVLGFLVEEGFGSDEVAARIDGAMKWAMRNIGVSAGGGTVEKISRFKRDLLMEFTANVRSGNYIPPEDAIMHEICQAKPAAKGEILQFVDETHGKATHPNAFGHGERG